jgi:nicotinate-nucleotide adenylyltransferase
MGPAQTPTTATGIGLLGGTFDPIHFGHLRLAEELAGALQLTEVRLIPAAQPAHRAAPGVDAQQRCRMVALAARGNPRLRVDDRELRRPTLSYTFDTLRELRQELGEATPLFFLLGADAFAGLPRWHRWQSLFELTHFVVAHRPGYHDWQAGLPPELASEWQQRLVTMATPCTGGAGTIRLLPTTALDISATAIRDLLLAGLSPRYLLPDAVLEYIRAQRLYGQPSSATPLRQTRS